MHAKIFDIEQGYYACHNFILAVVYCTMQVQKYKSHTVQQLGL